MKKNIPLFILLVATFGCNTTKNSNDLSFQSYVSSLKQVTLPHTFEQYYHFKNESIDTTALALFADRCSRPIGVIVNQENLAVIQYSNQCYSHELIYLLSYDSVGNILDTLMLQASDEDDGFEMIVNSYIDENLKIYENTIDKEFNLDEDFLPVDSLVKSSRDTYQLTSSGQFKLLNRFTKTLFTPTKFYELTIDTATLFGIWARDLDEPHADFLIDKHKYLTVDSEGDEIYYELKGDSIFLDLKKEVLMGKILNTQNDTLEIAWMEGSPTTYLRWPED